MEQLELFGNVGRSESEEQEQVQVQVRMSVEITRIGAMNAAAQVKEGAMGLACMRVGLRLQFSVRHSDSPRPGTR